MIKWNKIIYGSNSMEIKFNPKMDTNYSNSIN